jgi:hypothetical protein
VIILLPVFHRNITRQRLGTNVSIPRKIRGELGGACSIHGRDHNYIQDLNLKNLIV